MAALFRRKDLLLLFLGFCIWLQLFHLKDKQDVAQILYRVIPFFRDFEEMIKSKKPDSTVISPNTENTLSNRFPKLSRPS